MTQSRHCARCGAALAGDEPCPRCLLRTAVGVAEDELRKGPRRLRSPSIAELQPYFERLEIVSRLGSGGTGVVFAAREKASGREVALKVLTIRGGDDDFDERFAREARATAALKHPNIVAVEEYGRAGPDEEPWSYLVMERVEGASLRQVLRNGKVGPETALRWTAEICGALAYSHERGVIHRDIKPENVLIDPGGHAQVVDFGLAKLVQEGDAFLTRTGQVLGTFPYIAPEQYEHPSSVDRRADLYSLGVLAYELLTGEVPVGRFDRPSRRARVVPRVDEFVLKALARDPEQRFSTANEMRRELLQLEGRARPGRRGLFAAPQRCTKHFLVVGGVAYVLGAVKMLWSFSSDDARGMMLASLAIWVALADVVVGTAFAVWNAFERTDERRGSVGAVQPAEPWARAAIAIVAGLFAAWVLGMLLGFLSLLWAWGTSRDVGSRMDPRMGPIQVEYDF
jgi:hypothetical protein